MPMQKNFLDFIKFIIRNFTAGLIIQTESPEELAVLTEALSPMPFPKLI